MHDALAPPAAFHDACASFGIELEPTEVERLGRYLTLLLETNQRFNLTAVRDPDEAWLRLIFDSLTLLGVITSAGTRSVADVGSGAGMPGLPLAVVLPEVRFTLIESTGKKARFIADTAATLALNNVNVIPERAETLGQDREHHRERYDLVTARAVGPLPVLLELAVPLAKIGGHIVAIKGERAGEEVEQSRAALHLLHARVADTLRTPTGTLVVIEKQRKTPRTYPRRPGEPKRDPLGQR